MTKKDYKAIAGALNLTSMANGADLIVKTSLLEMLSLVFKADNPRFDAERFRAACYGEPFKK